MAGSRESESDTSQRTRPASRRRRGQPAKTRVGQERERLDASDRDARAVVERHIGYDRAVVREPRVGRSILQCDRGAFADEERASKLFLSRGGGSIASSNTWIGSW
jgi:hypothetical protein